MLAHLSPLIVALLLAGCNESQSALSPQGPQTERLAVIFWSMTVAGAAVFLITMIAAGAALFGSARTRDWLKGDTLVVAGGIVFPALTLGAVLILSLWALGAPPQAQKRSDPLKISVTGERWWWRVAYSGPDGGKVETANELRVPVGVPVEVELTSADVIHSFWAPRLAGKLDMFPGRKTKLRFTAGREGVSRGQCAEYCGGAHALMGFNVVALKPNEFSDWLRGQAATATPTTTEATAGRDLFLSSGCGVCHTIRGTTAVGALGPDLTHVASRMSIGAATLANDQATIAGWIVDNQHIKPGNKMPAYVAMDAGKVAALASYLSSLR